jgi:hypothetical protein
MIEDKLLAILAYLVIISVIQATAYISCKSCNPFEVLTTLFLTFILIIAVIIFALIYKILLLAALGGAAFVVLTVYSTAEEHKSRKSGA